MNRLLLPFVLLAGTFSSAAFSTTNSGKTFELTEKSILELTKSESVPSINEIKVTLLQAKYENGLAVDNLSYEAYVAHNHFDTKEKGTIGFNPVFSNINQYYDISDGIY